MSKPGPALSFYIKHGDDVTALLEYVDDENAPAGITGEDWRKFLRVIELAKDEAAVTIEACRRRIIEALGDAIVPIGNGAKRSRIVSDWDAWHEFAAPGPQMEKRTAVGWLGAYFFVEDDSGGKLVCYLRPKPAGGNFRTALGTPAPRPDHLPPESAVVFEARITAETDLDETVTACGEAFSSVREALGKHLARSPSS